MNELVLVGAGFDVALARLELHSCLRTDHAIAVP